MSTEKQTEIDFEKYIEQSRYARWIESESRRETWSETVARYCNYFAKKYPKHQAWFKDVAYPAILNKEVMPSMRCLMTAGPALDRDNMAGFNCSYLPIDDARAFDEMLYVLSCGTGVGFSVERQFINQLPNVAEEFHDTDTTLKIRDSRIGWATGLRELIGLLYQGQVPKWDLSSVRPAGTRLRTFGGRASGPSPLNDLFLFVVGVFKKAGGRKLNSVECHDICCKIAEVIIAGGVRRSALISLSNLSDERMRNAKTGQWWETNSQRTLANNSVAYTEKPDIGVFMKEWTALYESHSGERGIFNRLASKKAAAAIDRDPGFEFGANPCGEISLRPNQVCNLTEAIVRNSDTWEDIKRKLEIAAILGTFQATLTNFRYVRKIWNKNTSEEALLGVSLTGIMDSPLLNGEHEKSELVASALVDLREFVRSVNRVWAVDLGINPAAACTTIKPSGTVSQLVNSASGIHPRYSKYYIRTVRSDKKDPLGAFLQSQGVPVETDVYHPDVSVFSFPIKGPDKSVYRNDRSAIEQLEHYLLFKRNWTDHNVSITIYVKEDEWMHVGAWVYEHFDDLCGVSFLPHSDHVYKQAPYTEIDKAGYEKAVEAFPVVDWSAFYESEDGTTSARELACSSGACEIL